MNEKQHLKKKKDEPDSDDDLDIDDNDIEEPSDDADGDQNAVHNKGGNALAAQGGNGSQVPAHPGGIEAEIDVEHTDGKQAEADDLKYRESRRNLGGLPEPVRPEKEQIDDGKHAEAPNHKGHRLEIARIQSRLQKVCKVGNQHVGLGRHLAPLPGANHKLVFRQAKIDEERKNAERGEQDKAEPGAKGIALVGFHSSVIPFHVRRNATYYAIFRKQGAGAQAIHAGTLCI